MCLIIGCSYFSDSIFIDIDSFEVNASIGGTDTSLCSGNRLFLISNGDNVTNYLWSDNSTESELILTNEGSYTISVTNNCTCFSVKGQCNSCPDST